MLLAPGYLNETESYLVSMTNTGSYIQRDGKHNNGNFTLDKYIIQDYWIKWEGGSISMGASEVSTLHHTCDDPVFCSAISLDSTSLSLYSKLLLFRRPPENH